MVQLLQGERRRILHARPLAARLRILYVLQLTEQFVGAWLELAEPPPHRRSIAASQVNVDAVGRIPALDVSRYEMLNARSGVHSGHGDCDLLSAQGNICRSGKLTGQKLFNPLCERRSVAVKQITLRSLRARGTSITNVAAIALLPSVSFQVTQMNECKQSVPDLAAKHNSSKLFSFSL